MALTNITSLRACTTTKKHLSLRHQHKQPLNIPPFWGTALDLQVEITMAPCRRLPPSHGRNSRRTS